MSSFAGQYIKDCNSVYRKISSNPFLETVHKRINTTVPMPAVVIADMYVFRVGHELYREYVSTRFVTGKEDVINSKISKNFLKLPRHSAEHTIVNLVSTLKPSIIVKLRGACTQRSDLATTFCSRIHWSTGMSGKRWASLSRHQKPDIEVYRTSSTLKVHQH